MDPTAERASPVAAPAERLARRAASGALWASLESWGQQLIQLLVFIVLARLLGPEAWGLVAIAMIVTAVGETLITDAGWAEALIQKRDLEPADLDSVFWFVMAASLGFALLALGAAGPVAAWFGAPEVGRVLPWLAWILPLSALGVVPRALLRRELAFRTLALRSFVGMLGGGAAGVGLALAGAGVWSLVAYQLTQPLLEAVVLWAAFPWRPGLGLSRRRLAGILAFVWGVLGERLLMLADFLVPRVLIGHALGPALLGHYTLARKILELTSRLLVTPLSRVAMPAFAEVGHDPKRLGEALSLGVQLSALAAFPGFLGLAVVAPDLVPLLFGRQWAAAVPAIQLAALFGPALPLTRLSAALMLALGQARAVLALAAMGTALFLIFLLVPGQISVEGVLAALVARSYLMLPVRLFWVQRALGIDVLRAVRSLVPLLGAGVLMAAAVLAVREALPPETTPAARLGLGVLTGIAVYAAALALWARPLLARTLRLARSLLAAAPSASHRQSES